jgi:hypothetical protein
MVIATSIVSSEMKEDAMKTVTITRCPMCPEIKGHTQQVVDGLRNEPNTRVVVKDGAKGEFSIHVDGREVARKAEALPDVQSAIAAVKNASADRATIGSAI